MEKLSNKVPGSNRTAAELPGVTAGGMVTNVPARGHLLGIAKDWEEVELNHTIRPELI